MESILYDIVMVTEYKVFCMIALIKIHIIFFSYFFFFKKIHIILKNRDCIEWMQIFKKHILEV